MEPGRLEGKSPQVGSRGKANKLKQNVKIEYNFFTFSCKTFSNFINTGAELGQYFCAYTIEKQIEDSMGGLNPHNPPLGTSEGFSLSRQHWFWGTLHMVKCTQCYDACPIV